MKCYYKIIKDLPQWNDCIVIEKHIEFSNTTIGCTMYKSTEAFKDFYFDWKVRYDGDEVFICRIDQLEPYEIIRKPLKFKDILRTNE